MIKLILLLVLVGGIATTSLFSCSDSNNAAIEVVKDKVSNQIQSSIGKGDIAIKEYEIKIQKIKDALIKTKVSRKILESKIQAKKASLNNVIDVNKSAIISSSVEEMEGILIQIQDAEKQIEETLKRMIVNFDVIKAKVVALEVKKEMMETLSTIEQYTNIDTSINGFSSDLDKTIKSIEHDILNIEAELEVNNLIKDI